MCGVVSVRSWFPRPLLGFERVIEDAIATWACERGQVRVETFVRV